VPPGTSSVVVPEQLLRSAEHIRASRRRAAMLTPVTLVQDTGYVALFIVFCFGFGQCP
jgi:hypothetical protein